MSTPTPFFSSSTSESCLVTCASFVTIIVTSLSDRKNKSKTKSKSIRKKSKKKKKKNQDKYRTIRQGKENRQIKRKHTQNHLQLTPSSSFFSTLTAST